MKRSSLGLSLDEMSWIDAAAHLARDARLLVPVGALEQHGPHLPLGSNVLVARRLAVDLSQRHDVLRAPTLHYGVNVPSERVFAGTASFGKKTLHRAVNELLACWETHGITEFILVTAHRHEPHLEALASLITSRARVRVVEAWDVDVSELLERQAVPFHGCEAETSVMLYLYPELVRMDRARDFEIEPEAFERYRRGGPPAPPAGGAGAVGYPTAANADKGGRIYHRILDAISRAVFGSLDAESDTL
jgi:creatinine amidohydrolase